MKSYYNKEDIISLLNKNDDAVIRGLLALYELQTKSERKSLSSQEVNGEGFNRTDAKILSGIAMCYKQNMLISRKQLDAVRSRIKKYASQLAEIANKKAKLASEHQHTSKSKKLPKFCAVEEYLLKDSLKYLGSEYIYTFTQTELGLTKDEWPTWLYIETIDPPKAVGEFVLLSYERDNKNAIIFTKYMHDITGEILIVFVD